MNTAIIKPQWGPLTIALMVLGFVVWFPLGLAMLAYILWGEMFGGSAEKAQGFVNRTRSWAENCGPKGAHGFHREAVAVHGCVRRDGDDIVVVRQLARLPLGESDHHRVGEAVLRLYLSALTSQALLHVAARAGLGGNDHLDAIAGAALPDFVAERVIELPIAIARRRAEHVRAPQQERHDHQRPQPARSALSRAAVLLGCLFTPRQGISPFGSVNPAVAPGSP